MNLQKEISIITVETVVFTKKTSQSCFNVVLELISRCKNEQCQINVETLLCMSMLELQRWSLFGIDKSQLKGALGNRCFQNIEKFREMITNMSKILLKYF